MFNKRTISIIIALICFALSGPLVKALSSISSDMNGGITFCNLLFLGNFISGVVVLTFFGTKGIIKEILSFKTKQYLWLLVCVVIAALYPGLIFKALESTSVTNLVMLSRFESILYGFLAWILFRNALSRNEVIGLLTIGFGVLSVVYVKEMYMFKGGDYIILIAAVVEAFAIVISKETLKFCSLKTFLFVRNFFSAIGFFVTGIFLFGIEHYTDVLMPELWGLISIYAGVAIILGQFMWYRGIKSAPPEVVSNLTMLTPFLTLFFAYILLQETLDNYEILAISLILLGMIITKIKPKSKEINNLMVDKSLAGG